MSTKWAFSSNFVNVKMNEVFPFLSINSPVSCNDVTISPIPITPKPFGLGIKYTFDSSSLLLGIGCLACEKVNFSNSKCFHSISYFKCC